MLTLVLRSPPYFHMTHKVGLLLLLLQRTYLTLHFTDSPLTIFYPHVLPSWCLHSSTASEFLPLTSAQPLAPPPLLSLPYSNNFFFPHNVPQPLTHHSSLFLLYHSLPLVTSLRVIHLVCLLRKLFPMSPLLFSHFLTWHSRLSYPKITSCSQLLIKLRFAATTTDKI